MDFNVCILCIINHSARYVYVSRATRNSDRYGNCVRWAQTCLPSYCNQQIPYMTLCLIISPNDFPWHTIWTFHVPSDFRRLWIHQIVVIVSSLRLEFMVPKLFLPFVSVPTPANNWPFKFQLVLHNVANSTQNSATIIYFGFVFKVNTQIWYSQRVYILAMSVSTFSSNKMCTNSSNVIEADVNSSKDSKDSRDSSLSVNGSHLLYSLCISVMFIFILLRTYCTCLKSWKKNGAQKEQFIQMTMKFLSKKRLCEFLPNAWNFLSSFHWTTLARFLNISNIQISCE